MGMDNSDGACEELTVSHSTRLNIHGGRHPVAEFELSKRGIPFTANDTVIYEKQQLHVITGPNMYVDNDGQDASIDNGNA